MKVSSLGLDKIEAWQYGPVVPSIYYEFKSKGNKPIVGDFNVHIEQEDKDILDEVWEIFGQYSASHLVDMTHAHDPWKSAYNNGKKVITKEKG